MRTAKTAVAFLLAFAACSGAKGETTPTESKSTAAMTVELGEIALYEGDHPIILIHADGTTGFGGRFEGMSGPTIKADGTIVEQGRPIIRINADGTLTDLTGKLSAIPIHVTADKVTATRDGKHVGFDLTATGALAMVGMGEDSPVLPFSIQGASSPGKRRAILAFMSVVFFWPEVPEPTRDRTEGAPAETP